MTMNANAKIARAAYINGNTSLIFALVMEAVSYTHLLACQMSNFSSPAKSRTNALMLVERHVDAVSAAADSNSRVTFACLDSLRQLMGKVGIVAAFGRVGSVIFVRPAFGFQPTADLSLIHIFTTDIQDGSQKFKLEISLSI